MPESEGLVRGARLAALRQLLLDQPERLWSTRELAERFGVSDDTMTNDLHMLSSRGQVPLRDNGKSTIGFRWQVDTEKLSRLTPLHLDYAQGAALYAALRLLSQQYDNRNDAVRNALIQLIGVLPAPLQPQLEAIVAQLPHTDVQHSVSETFAVLSQGWLLQRQVKLVYEPPHKHAFECYFEPYLLEPLGISYTIYFLGRCTIIAPTAPPSELRTFKLERVLQAELTEHTFTVPLDFAGVALLNRAWGVMYGEGEPVHLKLRFNQSVSSRVQETRWHISQKLTPTAEGLVWEADIGDTTEIRPWIRGWGADCEVLEPAELRNELIRETRKLIKRYGSANSGVDSVVDKDEPDQSFLDDLFGKD